jgi:1-deoxy-D-xylulose-5-phosphate synthase
VRIGWPDQFIEHGKIDALRTKYGITVDAAIEKLRPVLAATVPQTPASAVSASERKSFPAHG